MGKLFNKKSKTTDETPTIASQPTSKKIGFFSAMLVAMGSSIGAGIFFKAQGVLKDSHGSLVLAIIAWIIAAFAVISMALALVEIASARNDNLSLIGWCKTFNSRKIYKASKNFMAYIYLPLTYFFMPFYVILSLQDAISAFGDGSNTFMIGGNGKADWVIWFIIAMLIAFFFIFVSGMSSRAGNIINMGIMAIKFIPLLGVVVIGIVMFAMNPDTINVSAGPIIGDSNITSPEANDVASSFEYMTPGIGLFMAIGAIFFAYDGFYVTAGLQSEMKEPKKTPMAIVLGLGAVTIIYLAIAIVMSLSGDGGLYGFKNWLAGSAAGVSDTGESLVIREGTNVLWVFGLLNLTIAIGVLGIINGFAMWAPRFVEDLIKDDELPFSQKYRNRLNPNKPMVGIWYSVVITLPVVIVFTLIGALAYYNDYGLDYGTKEIGSLYTFCDLTGTWTAVFAFMFIMLPIAGGLKNRRTNRVKTEQKKYFVWSAWVSVIIISIVLLVIFVDAFVNVFMLINLASLKEGYYEIVGGTHRIVGRVMKLVTLFIFVGLMTIPTMIEDKIHIKKYGSIQNYERALNLEPTMA